MERVFIAPGNPAMEDFIKVHIQPHPTNKTIITFADGEQRKFGKFDEEPNNSVDEDQVDVSQPLTIDDTKE